MGYYVDKTNFYSEIYNVVREDNDIIDYSTNGRIITKNKIIIINNESITFNLEKYDLYYITKHIIKEEIDKKISSEKINPFIIEQSGKKSPYDKIKIKVDFGDGQHDLLVKPLSHKNFILGNKTSWCTIEHFYSFKEKEYFEKGGKIIFEIKNIEGLCDIIIIPFELINSSVNNYNAKLDLMSANLTNDNNISFVFNNVQDNQLIFASTKNS